MRTIVGVIAVMGLAVTVAEAQPPRERGAAFRPPEPLKPGDVPSVARGAAEEFLPSTPVAQTLNRASGGAGPAWLTDTDTDPNVRTTAGSVTKTGSVRPLTPPPTSLQPKDDPKLAAKASDWLRTPSPERRSQPVPTPQPEQATAMTPYRGISANGAPVYAGPPAYRWYGWGTVTPGANPFAPTGQFPKASANWYSITGATPGAFPVPVMNPLRTPPGHEPPNYGTAHTPTPVVPFASQPPRLQPAERPEPLRYHPPVDSKFAPGVGLAPPALFPPPVPVNVPKLTPPPTVSPVTVKDPVPTPVLSPVGSRPVVTLPAFLPHAAPSVEPARPVAMTPPNPLPLSVIDEPEPTKANRIEVTVEAPKYEEPRWQSAPKPTHPAPGTWAPAGAPLPIHTNDTAPSWKSGAAGVNSLVARAESPDAAAHQVATLIRQMCKGRAEGVDIRWSDTNMLVCFEVRDAVEAQNLVTDISRRPELGLYKIDFSVVLK